ncbi:MAG: modulated sigma54 specific transcriptional regulator, Fis family [Solirubrobacterales bacterium]|nr:modulated sigma54 specific transcriptional regulator, Fis family [Solirubrobacterales bacterium]
MAEDRDQHQAREAFLASGRIDPSVRSVVARSWQRSLTSGMGFDERPRRPGVPDPDGAIVRAAGPVAERLLEQLGDLPLAVLLTDPDARVLARWTRGARTQDAVDDGDGIPGVSFGEQTLGTNALGAVVEEGRPVAVSGPEHLSPRLQRWACMAAPVRHPVTRRIEGVIDLSCLVEHTSPLMLPLVTRIADEIGERLGAGDSRRDRLLLDAYLRLERRGPRRPMFAVNRAMIIANPSASDLLVGLDQHQAWEWTQRLLARPDGDGALPDAPGVRGHAHAVEGPSGLVGAIVSLQTAKRVETLARRSPSLGELGVLRRAFPGRSLATEDLLGRALTAARRSSAILIAGEPGVGKQRLARALHTVAAPHTRLAVHDAVSCALGTQSYWLHLVAKDLADPHAAVLLLHLEQLRDAGCQALCDRLAAPAPNGGLVIATLATSSRSPATPARLESAFLGHLTVPPLRDRPEDVDDIASAVLAEAARGVRELAPETLRVLRAFDWPDNARQLRSTVIAGCRAAPGSVVRPADLPELAPRLLTRTLGHLERVELETIAEAVRAAGGNKARAAAQLGISRSTLYRRLSDLEGLGVPSS